MDELSELPSMSSMSGFAGGTEGAGSTLTGSEETPQERRERKRNFVRMGAVVIIVLLILDIILLYLFLTSKPNVVVKRHTQYFGHIHGLHGQQLASSPTLPAVVECNSPGCQWLQQYLRGISGKAEPCQDFYAHTCEGVAVDLMTQGLVKFMQATGDAIFAHDARYEERQHVSVFNNCMRARDIMPRDLWRIEDDEPCPLTASKVPWYVAPFLKEGGNVSEDLLGMLIDSLSPGLRAALQRPPADLSWQQHLVATGWMYRAARRVKHIARCHMSKSGVAQSGGLSYDTLWILFYFAPFLGEEGNVLMKHVFRATPFPRLQICLRILEDNFRTATEKAAFAVLTDMLDDPRGTVGHVVWEAKQASRNTIASWLGQSVVHKVDILEYHLLGSPRITKVTDPSVFSSQVVYSPETHSLLIPPALLGNMLNVTPAIEPVFIPLLGGAILRTLFQAASSWLDRSPMRDTAVCLKGQLDVDPQLGSEIALWLFSHPSLYELYKRRLQEEIGPGVKLCKGYTNTQLYFVVWASTQCGESSSAVNGPLANIERFARSFSCLHGQKMVAPMRCRAGETLVSADLNE